MDYTKDDKCVNHLLELNEESAVVHFVIVIHCVVKICDCYPLCGILCILYVHYVALKYVTGNDGIHYVVVKYVTGNDEEMSILLEFK